MNRTILPAIAAAILLAFAAASTAETTVSEDQAEQVEMDSSPTAGSNLDDPKFLDELKDAYLWILTLEACVAVELYFTRDDLLRLIGFMSKTYENVPVETKELVYNSAVARYGDRTADDRFCETSFKFFRFDFPAVLSRTDELPF